MTQDKILPILQTIIKDTKKRKISLNNGNCGMFALALHNYLETIGIQTKIALFCAAFDNDENDPEIFENLIFSDAPLYHVALMDDNNNYYDADGCVTKDYILQWIKDEYGEGPDYVAQYHLDMEKFNNKKSELEHYFRAETNYQYNVEQFTLLINHYFIDNKDEIVKDLEHIKNDLKKQNIRLSAGNCGVFALNFHDHLKQKNIDTDFIIFTKTKSKSKKPIDLLEDILLADDGILHVALIDNKQNIYDEDICTNTKNIKKWIDKEYSKEKKTQTYIIPSKYRQEIEDVINTHTDYMNTVEDFKKIFQQSFPKENKAKSLSKLEI